MSLHIAELSDERIGTIVDDIETKGFAMLPNFVGADDLARMRDFVFGAVQKSKGEYAGFTGPDAVSGSGLDELARSQPFRDMMERIYARGTGQKPPKGEFYQVLRCLSGQSARKHSYLFHYDSYVITLLIPIQIPTSGLTGDFLMLPNTRRIRKIYLSNVVDKLFLDNKVTQWALRKLTKIGLIRLTRVKMVPGNAYFFWGYRSVHTNEPCDPDQVRATALFHYVNPHAGASIVPAPRFRAQTAARH